MTDTHASFTMSVATANGAGVQNTLISVQQAADNKYNINMVTLLAVKRTEASELQKLGVDLWTWNIPGTISGATWTETTGSTDGLKWTLVAQADQVAPFTGSVASSHLQNIHILDSSSISIRHGTLARTCEEHMFSSKHSRGREAGLGCAKCVNRSRSHR